MRNSVESIERALEVEKAPFPKPGERCWIMVLRNFREYERKVFSK